ncbi:pseudaminic acid synthase [uncultured Roseibium sp.]|uniref:pseudaminic acid synthase n=1 Tax=uncultured Roseibium sp. TaxID=1936171 RepID=UPI003216CCB5
MAELSGNHNGDINRALKLIEIAAESGADAVKLQTYTADSLVLDCDRPEFVLSAPASTWNGRRLYDLYREAHTPWGWHKDLFARAEELGITIFSAPFDKAAVGLLEGLGTPAYKLASNELHDWPLVAEIVRTGKPIILSAGVATLEDLTNTLEFMRREGARDIVVLHCVSAYPAPLEDTNLRTMEDIARRFDVVVGLSDHTMGVEASVAAVVHGASVIEKHITLDRHDGGPDSSFSLEPDELKTLCRETKAAWKNPEGARYDPVILGEVKYGGTTDLKTKGIYTRQFWTIRDIKAGDIFSEDNIKSIRGPSDSGAVSTMSYKEIYGAIAREDIARHEPVLPSMVGKRRKPA